MRSISAMFGFSFIWQWFGLLLAADSLLRLVLLALRWVKPAPRVPGGDEAARGCVVLIAAHDEAGTIGATVAALRPHLAEWPGSELHVVADRCTDATALEAVMAGARVAERRAEQGAAQSNGRLGKCAVIDWWLQHHRAAWEARAAVFVLDADSRLQPGSLASVRRALADESVVAAQTFVAPDASTTAGRLAGWSEVLMQRIDDEARRRCGWPVPLRGTGMAVRGALLAELAAGLHTLAEDLELDVMLAARRARVVFVPEAVVFDPKPRQTDGASRQRARWFEGQLQVIKGYRREIATALLRGGAGAWFLLVLLLLRPKLLFIALRLLCVALSLTLAWLWPGGAAGVLWFAVAGLVADALYYLLGARFVDAPQQYLRDLLAVPRYVMMWAASFGLALFRRGGRVWLRAGRS